MPVKHEDVLDVMRILGEQENITIAVKHSVAGGIMTGVGATAGGLLLGPVGLAIGGAAAGLVASLVYKDSFMSVGEAIQHMGAKEKRMLAGAVQRVLDNIDASDAVQLLAIISGDPLLRGMVIQAMRSQLSEMGLPILK